jgi:hypothetical protein
LEVTETTVPDATQDFPPDLAPYGAEIRLQAVAAKAAFDSLERRITARKDLARQISTILRSGVPIPHPLKAEREQFERLNKDLANSIAPILGDIQAFLAAVGLIAGILWPSKMNRKGEDAEIAASRLARGERLRGVLGVSGDSKLRVRGGGEGDVRGGMLHFDEMIDAELRKGSQGEVATFWVGSSLEGTDAARPPAIRWLDEDSLVLWVAGRHGSLREYMEAVRDVGPRIQSKAVLSFVRGEGPPRENAIPLGMGLKFDR